MKWSAKIAVVAGALLLAGCRELPRYFASDEILARAGGRELRLRDVRDAIPQGLSPEDSTAYMKMYVDRWVRKQLKLEEAEVLWPITTPTRATTASTVRSSRGGSCAWASATGRRRNSRR